MILQQTLSAKEKVASILAVLFLVGLVTFGYTQTVVEPTQASVLHAGAIEEDYTTRYAELQNQFKEIKENVDTLKSVSVKVKLRALKECLAASRSFEKCQTLFEETETQIDTITKSVESLDSAVLGLEQNVVEYSKIVDQALNELKKKNAATLGKVGH